MAYFDGVVIKGRRFKDDEEVFITLVVKTNKMGLERNEKKKDKIFYSVTKALPWV